MRRPVLVCVVSGYVVVIEVAGANAAVRRFIPGRNDRCGPFTWTKPADEILAKAIREETSLT
jgi:hypothetical protein